MKFAAFLVGPTFYRVCLSGGTLDRKLGTCLVDSILGGFAPRNGGAPARRTRS